MGLDHTLLTIPNRRCWPVLCKAGVQGIVPTHEIRGTLPLTNVLRCAAPGTDLDSKWRVRHSRAHTALLVNSFELGVLWDQFGIVGGVTVRIHFLIFFFQI
jgi:hypothetical protein